MSLELCNSAMVVLSVIYRVGKIVTVRALSARESFPCCFYRTINSFILIITIYENQRIDLSNVFSGTTEPKTLGNTARAPQDQVCCPF